MSIIENVLATDGYIQYNGLLACKFGVYEAIILGELFNEYRYYKVHHKKYLEAHNDAFFSTSDNIEKRTGINYHGQSKAIKNLVASNLLEVKLIGVPAKRHFKLNVEAIQEALLADYDDLGNFAYDYEDTEETAPAETEIESLPFGSSKPAAKPEAKAEPSVNETTKDLKVLMSYIRNEWPEYSEELIKYVQAFKGRFTLAQLKAKVADIQNETNNNTALINQSIHEAFVNSYAGFYLPKEKKSVVKASQPSAQVPTTEYCYPGCNAGKSGLLSSKEY